MTSVRNMPVMAKCCPTCPFNAGGDPAIRAKVEERSLTQASQICHHPRLHGQLETHLCRGARDHQLTIFFRLGVIDAPTDEAWARKADELLGPVA